MKNMVGPRFIMISKTYTITSDNVGNIKRSK